MLASLPGIWINNLIEAYDKDYVEYMPKEEAYEKLKQATKQDFGYDGDAWRRWFREEAKRYLDSEAMRKKRENAE